MDQVTHEVRLQQWKEIIQAQLASGQSKRAWCQENGVSEKQFFTGNGESEKRSMKHRKTHSNR